MAALPLVVVLVASGLCSDASASRCFTGVGITATECLYLLHCRALQALTVVVVLTPVSLCGGRARGGGGSVGQISRAQR